MNKHLLLGSAIIFAMSAFSQNAKVAKPSGITNKLVRNYYVNEEKNTNKTLKNGPAKDVFRPSAGAKIGASAATSCTHFSGSSNVYGFYQDGHEALQFNEQLNAVTFVHRASPTYSTVPNGNSGTMVTKWTINNGTSWDSTVIWANTTNLGRYPQGGLYNPLGNTNINNAYAVAMGEAVVSGFDGSWICSKKLTTPGTTTAGTDQQFFSNVSPFATLGKKIDFPRYGFTFTNDGFVRGLGEVCNDINNTSSNLGYGPRGDAILKGTFTAGAFVWSYDSLIPPTILRTDGSKQLTTRTNLMAWNDAGTIGYVVIIGARAGTTGAMKGYQPIVYKTTNSGATWSLLPANDFTTPQYQGLVDRLWATSSNTNLVVPFFSAGEGMDAAVDVNGNLHIATTVVGSYSNDNDSLEYTSTWGTEGYSFPYFAAVYPTIYDFYTNSSGGWDYHIVDSMGTEGPSSTNTDNPWVAAAVPLDARIQVSFSPDRKKIFYSWTESDTTLLGKYWNVYPDIKMRGFDVTINKVTARQNVTGGVTTPSNADQQAYWHFMSNRAMLTNTTTGTHEIPFTISYNSANDGDAPTNHYYLKGASFDQADFSLNPLSPVGVASIVNNTPDYDVVNYPNPANDFTIIAVNLKQGADFEINVYNTVGQLIQTIKTHGQIGNNNVNLDLSGLSSGVYVYNVKVGNSSVTKKLIVE